MGSWHCMPLLADVLRTTVMMPVKLPLDVVDHILSFLQSDMVALKACSRTHPSLSRLAERYLYAYITFDMACFLYHRGNEEIELFEILSERPHIAKYIRSFDIYFDIFSTPKDISSALLIMSQLRRIKLVLMGGEGV